MATVRRRFSIVVLLAWLVACGAHWDLLQSLAWGRMIASYSRTMPLREAVRLAFTADNLCGLCEIVAEARTRSDASGNDAGRSAVPAGISGKTPLALPPEHVFVFHVAPSPGWPSENFLPDACARPAPPTEPPRAA